MGTVSPERPAGPVRPVAAVGAVAFDERGRVLLVRRGHPPEQSAWSVPGGRIEPGERVTEAVAREMAEETGLQVAVLGLVAAIDWIERAPGGELVRHFVILDHLVEVLGGELAAGDDADEAEWFALDELARLTTTAGLVDVIERARAMAAGLATPPRLR
ncbi:MAG TPA: NUDIX hydrolase [Kofleriaceae bacterium]|nr:NUDIX hydrolase [Kofleriaceae bacterium]